MDECIIKIFDIRLQRYRDGKLEFVARVQFVGIRIRMHVYSFLELFVVTQVYASCLLPTHVDTQM